ncbi:MAG TPA: undecaprenyl/decaprenyl-phosphate alpha-N-acetylglucosaminyl 1-phosphate transferase, partial [Nocardioidaceae bacterium]|nr:undecaprenyl/decaprenyl-phosphate alpha-N-acetylglucosaminyl 1-phosphate transferase [Nocardioidaceae bacterium]
MREYLLILFVAAGTTYLLATVARELAVRVGAVAAVRDRDVHAIPIPYFGGVAILGGLAAALLLAQRLPFLGSSQDQVFSDARAVLLGGLAICAVGVIDDLFELDAVTKLAGQVLAAGLVVVQGMQLYWLPL